MTEGDRRRAIVATVQNVLGEVRRSLIVVLAALAVASAVAYAHVDRVIALLQQGSLPGFVFLVPTEAFTVRVKVSLFLGFVAALPVALWQLSRFAARALGVRASRWTVPLVLISYALFLSGIAFGYRCVLPYALKFFLSFSGDTLRPMITFSSYVSFVAGATVPFGLVFQLPVVIGALARAGVITYQAMRKNRGYIIVGAFCLAAVLTPADVFSQVALAVPIIILFEIGAVVALLVGGKMSGRKRPKGAQAKAPGDS